jgi:hypothetical protein
MMGLETMFFIDQYLNFFPADLAQDPQRGVGGEKGVNGAIGAVNQAQIPTVLVVIRDEKAVAAVGIATKEIVTGPMSSKFLTFCFFIF